ncbi:MAG: ATP-binding cassette domain-containing protein [Chitinophagales bacterium]|nr:ATP-binding cassette domain-containing protein [Chitinophagales bacterium]
MPSVLKISSLHKFYNHVHAVNDLTLTIEPGNIFGILGPNGSGKSTTLGIILGVIHASSGSFTWFEKPFSKEALLRIGALLEQPNIYPYLSAVNNLKISCDIKNIPYSGIDGVLQTVGLSNRRNDLFKNFSFGMKQRLAIASALLNQPEVLVLDEPTNGLDPQGIADVRNLIRSIALQGTTIILASHMLDEVEKVCTHVAVLKQGEVLISGLVNEVVNENASVEFCADDELQLVEAMHHLSYLRNITKTSQGIFSAALAEPGITGSRINQDFFEKGICLSYLSFKKKTLESYFLEITKQ